MQKAHGKENKKQRSLVSVLADDVSDSEDDFPINDLPLMTKRSAIQRLPFSNSPVKRNALVVTQGKGHIRKPQYDPVTHQKQRCSNAERHDKLQPEYSAHKSASRTVRRVSICECCGITRPCIDGSLARDEDGGRRRQRRRCTRPYRGVI